MKTVSELRNTEVALMIHAIREHSRKLGAISVEMNNLAKRLEAKRQFLTA